MNFYQTLINDTGAARGTLLSAPIIQRALQGRISLQEYVAFLCQAYHHVSHTVPLLMAVGSRLPRRHAWLLTAVTEYIAEENGHDQWILNDIEACGFDSGAVRNSSPSIATELMLSYAYDMTFRVNPLGFFGMVHVLEGTSVAIAQHAADSIRQSLALPKQAFSYLYSHGALDQEHVQFFASLMDRIEDPADRQQIVHAARVFFRLYGDIFQALDGAPAPALAA